MSILSRSTCSVRLSQDVKFVPVLHLRSSLATPSRLPRYAASGCKFFVGKTLQHVAIVQIAPTSSRKLAARAAEARRHSPSYRKWDSTTEKLTESSTLAFLLLMTPQIVKNARTLLAGDPAPVGILPWMGYSTGLLGNLLLLSYFASKKELGATLVQAVGVVSTFVLLSQIFVAGFMPPPAFALTTVVVAVGLTLNLLNYKGVLSPAIWSVWQDAAGLVGLTVLPQVICATFSSHTSTTPGVTAGLAGLAFIILSRAGILPAKLRGLWAGLSAWTATLLFMFMPLAQLWSCLSNPAKLAGISLLTTLLGMIGNGLMVPRALFTRDLIWFTGSAWGTVMMGWAILFSMFRNNVVNKSIFWSATSALALYISVVLVQDFKAHAPAAV